MSKRNSISADLASQGIFETIRGLNPCPTPMGDHMPLHQELPSRVAPASTCRELCRQLQHAATIHRLTIHRHLRCWTRQLGGILLTPTKTVADLDLTVLHTQVFKKATRGHGDNAKSQLQMVEQDSRRIQRVRRPEFFVYGILGHVRDSWGGHIQAWREANRISNYWRRYFQIPEVSYDSLRSDTWYHSHDENIESPKDVNDTCESENPDDDTMSTAAQPGAHDTPVPAQIHQLATILYNILVADEDYNAPILEKLHTDPSNNQNQPPQLWTTEGLSHLSSYFSITACELARLASRTQPGSAAALSDDDDGL